MYDTHITLVGNVLTAPEWRRTKNTGSLVANFKVASTARRLDRESGQWVDGNSLRVRVTCWRRLAEGVASSVITGDPVIVVGRLYTRDWTDENNNPRVGYELEAVAVGHDLSRGVGRFVRNRPAMATSTVEDDQDVIRIAGQVTDAVAMAQAPATRDARFLGELSDGLPAFQGSPMSAYGPMAGPAPGFQPAAHGETIDATIVETIDGELEDDDLGDDELSGDELPDDGLDSDDLDSDDLGGDGLDGDESTGARPGGDEPDDDGSGGGVEPGGDALNDARSKNDGGTKVGGDSGRGGVSAATGRRGASAAGLDAAGVDPAEADPLDGSGTRAGRSGRGRRRVRESVPA